MLRIILIHRSGAFYQNLAIGVQCIENIVSALSRSDNVADVLDLRFQFCHPCRQVSDRFIVFLHLRRDLRHLRQHIRHTAFAEDALAIAAGILVLTVIVPVTLRKLRRTRIQAHCIHEQTSFILVSRQRRQGRILRRRTGSNFKRYTAHRLTDIKQNGNRHISRQRFILILAEVDAVSCIIHEIMPVNPRLARAERDFQTGRSRREFEHLPISVEDSVADDAGQIGREVLRRVGAVKPL